MSRFRYTFTAIRYEIKNQITEMISTLAVLGMLTALVPCAVLACFGMDITLHSLLDSYEDIAPGNIEIFHQNAFHHFSPFI